MTAEDPPQLSCTPTATHCDHLTSRPAVGEVSMTPASTPVSIPTSTPASSGSACGQSTSEAAGAPAGAAAGEDGAVPAPAMSHFLELDKRWRQEELVSVWRMKSTTRQLEELQRKEARRIQLAIKQAERVAALHIARHQQQREREQQHALQQRAGAVVERWVTAHGPCLRGLLRALDWPPLVELLPLCKQCAVPIDDGADSAELRRSYLRTIRKIHPDKLQGGMLKERTAASAIFEALRTAHSHECSGS